DDPLRDDLQANLLVPRSEPDGRSSVVDEQDPTGILYCLNIRQSDLPRSEWLPTDSSVRLRVLEGVARDGRDAAEEPEPPMTRVLGEVDVDPDGSFNIRVPANIPIQLQLLDTDGMALRSCRWIWVRNREPRGCIGCHEDGELAPENRVVEAVKRSPMDLTLPPERRRSVTYGSDVAPLIRRSCASGACHGGGAPPRLASFEDVRTHVRGPARTSPLVWSLYGRGTSYPWDAPAANGERIQRMPPDGAAPLSDEDRRTLIEWIDMGAQDE
ncbi:MAG: hypothetical protein JW741_08135, partial [Sedimentisphaerales bacterium]|nr:hypothetical protein [Sedimentisphaerales bacterium]